MEHVGFGQIIISCDQVHFFPLSPTFGPIDWYKSHQAAPYGGIKTISAISFCVSGSPYSRFEQCTLIDNDRDETVRNPTMSTIYGANTCTKEVHEVQTWP